MDISYDKILQISFILLTVCENFGFKVLFLYNHLDEILIKILELLDKSI